MDAAFDAHEAFEPADGEYLATTTPFSARVTVEDAVRVTVTVPTLSAVVDGEVGDAVEDGWLETLERRLADADGVVRASEVAVETVEHDDDEVRATFRLTGADPATAADDAAAVVGYVEGTYVQGVVPGYDYRDPVAGLVARARETGSGGTGR
jgi:hypothetical protein